MRWPNARADLLPAPLAATAGRSASELLTKNNPTLGEVIWCHLDPNTVADDGLDAIFAHPASRIGDDPMIIFQQYAAAPVRKKLIDDAVQDEELLLSHASGRCEIDGRYLATAVGLQLVADPLILGQCLEARTLDCADVHETVGPAVVW